MILAVRAYALGESDRVPADLRLAFRCRRYQKLPVGSAIFDVPEWLLTKIDSALSVYDAYSAYQRKSPKTDDATWSLSNPGLFRVVDRVDRLKKEHKRARNES